ncbi:hypothetical protein CJF32_00005232 [Rutstroemia sp. NJR-2017a WRK4]|nr:hypothetical protein CJF32_00005232 [Rutstroemia sp. NJR-2017a WRK4]
MLTAPSPQQPIIGGGPIISITDMDSFMRLGESAQHARSHRPLKRTSSTDFDLMRASGEAAARRRRDNSPCPSPASRSPLLRPTEYSSSESESGDEMEMEMEIRMERDVKTPWRMTPSRYEKERVDQVMRVDFDVVSPFEVKWPFEIGTASQLRIISVDEYYTEERRRN